MPYPHDNTPSKHNKKPVPDGIWSQCADCRQILHQKELMANLMVCTSCGHHYQLSAPARISSLVDEGSFAEFGEDLQSTDPLRFEGNTPYKDTLGRYRDETGLSEAILVGEATLESRPLVLGVMDFRFVGGSMGMVVGEKITLAIERATEKRIPLVLFTASGGARMQEGIFSLMQMAKTTSALNRLKKENILYLVVMTHPTTGGVTASFAALGDVILAEPQALIGFAGPRVIQQTIGQKLPKDFQSAEFMLEKGLVDMVVPRHHLKSKIIDLYDLLALNARENTVA